MSEPISSYEAGKLLGITPARVRQLAAEGMIPGAYRITDNSHWLFEKEALVKFIKDRKREAAKRCRYTKEATFTGRSLSSRVSSSVNRLDALLSQKPSATSVN